PTLAIWKYREFSTILAPGNLIPPNYKIEHKWNPFVLGIIFTLLLIFNKFLAHSVLTSSEPIEKVRTRDNFYYL
ncbi:hypothetical protein, partial [Caproiciproducens galactitolivorans]|uniref:hypothetical protein n=1 Tax=Caproiciproducens galactitolivorans TaxID=642589 RepID=UPI0024095844